jgi:hypothetical protein
VGQRRHRWRGFAARAARWLTLLQTPRGKARPITASVRASNWASRSACPIGTSPNLPPGGGAPINGVVTDVLQVIGRRIKLDPSSGPRLTQLVDQDTAGSRAGGTSRVETLILWGMSADVLETLPGYGRPFCPTFPGFRDQRAPLSMAASSPGDGCRRKPKR